MSKTKRINPRRRPATQADVERAKNAAVREATTATLAIVLSVLLDKFGAQDYIQDVWREINNRSEAVMQGYASIADYKHILKNDYGIELK